LEKGRVAIPAITNEYLKFNQFFPEKQKTGAFTPEKEGLMNGRNHPGRNGDNCREEG